MIDRTTNREFRIDHYHDDGVTVDIVYEDEPAIHHLVSRTQLIYMQYAEEYGMFFGY